MKKIIIILFLALTFSACTNNENTVIMDRPAEDGEYHYSNQDYGFALTLPAEFEYYQTQKKDKTDYTEFQFFVPTADRTYPQEIQSYAEAVVVRIYTKEQWERINTQDYVNEIFPVKKEGNGFLYFLKIWPGWPKDWETKWSEEKDENLLTRLDIITK